MQEDVLSDQRKPLASIACETPVNVSRFLLVSSRLHLGYLCFLDPNIHQHATNYFLLALSLKPILRQERCSGRAHAVFGMFVKHGGPGCKQGI